MVMPFKMITLAIKQIQLKAKPAVSNATGPPPISNGNNVFNNHGPPRQIKISKVFAPKALLTVIEPTPTTKKQSPSELIKNIVIEMSRGGIENTNPFSR